MRKVVVNEMTGCWEWVGAQHKPPPENYGRVGFRSRLYRTHRFSYMIHVGPIPVGLWVLHRCDNPPCVNPAHLFLGTSDENIADRDRKGRQRVPKGEDNPHAALTNDQAAEIREKLAAGRRCSELATEYGVSFGVINSIKRGKTYRG